MFGGDCSRIVVLVVVLLLLLFAPTVKVVSSFAFVTTTNKLQPALGITRTKNHHLPRRSMTPNTVATNTVVNPPNLLENAKEEEVAVDTALPKVQVSFSHVQFYVDKVEELKVYKELERKLNTNWFETRTQQNAAGVEDTTKEDNGLLFVSQNRDVVKQLLAGLDFRVTGYQCGFGNTRSVLVTSKDPSGVQFVVTSISNDQISSMDHQEPQNEFHHFQADNVHQFYQAHSHRPGIAVLGFFVDSVDAVEARYQQYHPQLIQHRQDTPTAKMLQVYAYYYQPQSPPQEEEEEDKDASNDPNDLIAVDYGTVLRFVERITNDDDDDDTKDNSPFVLPGMILVDAQYPPDSQAAYCDHWVSNVYSRTGFLKTLEETLGFHPKVDFNAGVVAAGEAQIESTVTGNNSQMLTLDKKAALKDQSQVYLPINNALSKVGHVHGFLKELGQGIQHIASRVENLTAFVQRGNDNRKLTGEGFTFLRIPRSYYGTLSVQQLVGIDDEGLSIDCATAIMDACEHCHIMTPDGAVDLDVAKDRIDECLLSSLKGNEMEEYMSKKEAVLATILRSRYANLYSLLRHHLSEESYLGLVRNQILVDVQGDDLLYQIFTSNILQRRSGDEAPFLEFIQRVCSECRDEDGCPVELKPGCGGFGIRNFLTLFLSIEVSKAMLEVVEAKKAGDEDRHAYAQAMVDCFTCQLNESNPILTEISDAMTEEGHYRDKMMLISAEGKSDEADVWRLKMEAASRAKQIGNDKLMECSTKYKDLMRAIRERRSLQLDEKA